jgi:hypothetical protein
MVSVVGGWLVQIVDPELAVFENAVWWAFLRLSDPGYLGDDHGAIKRVIATVITVLGYVLFMGALVAIMTQWLHETIRKLESGLTPISRNGHILILGWTNRTAPIIREIFSSGGRLKRFLKHFSRGGLHVVILAPEVSPELTYELKEELGGFWNPRKITFRSGVPNKAEDLKRVDCLHSSVIILPGKGLNEEGIESIDAGTVKSLLTISNLALNTGITAPPIVTEIMDTSRVAVTEKSYTGPIEVLSSISIISRLICQTVRNPGMSQVYAELMTKEIGTSLYVRTCPEHVGKSWSDVALQYSASVPIGVFSDADEGRIDLCPNLSYQFQAEDKLVFISRHLADTHVVHKTLPSPLEGAPKNDSLSSIENKKILILGWSQKLPFLLRELSRHKYEQYDINILSMIPTDQRIKSLASRELEDSNIVIRHTEADYTLPKTILDVNPAGYDHIVFLASDWINTHEQSDSRTILGYLLLEESFKNVSDRPCTLIELVDPSNETLFAKRRGEVIISPRIISHMVGSVALKMDLNTVFNELFESGGAEFGFLKATPEMVASENFQKIQNLSMTSTRIPVGIRYNSGEEQKVILAPTSSTPLKINSGDEIIVLQRRNENP